MVCKENCKDNSQCGENEVCIKGECQSGCINDDHCKQGEKCYDESCVPTCEDGIQNQNETGIDCGGPCPACGSNNLILT